MMDCFTHEAGDAPVIPVRLIRKDALEAGLEPLSPLARGYAEAVGFTAKPGEVLAVPSAQGAVETLLVGLGAGEDPGVIGAAPQAAPPGLYQFEALSDVESAEALIAWARGAYRFTRYKAAAREPARLLVEADGAYAAASHAVDAIALVRDLINTPAGDMGPVAVEAAVRSVAEAHGADVTVTRGDALLEHNYPLIHAVGRAADEEPRLIELVWGEAAHPRIALIGKGVTFDTGGLNIKTGDYMRLMKKDMGGAAHALALAQWVMATQLPCRLHLLIPAVENSISDEAFRPGDILNSRAGLTVEVENTDAEGRLVLADALTRAREDEPALMLDFATLTGAARVAMGSDVAPFFTHDDTLAGQLEEGGRAAADPVWRLPLHAGYRRQLDSPIADLKNLGDTPLGGAILAALFLERFAGAETVWAHFDVYAWNMANRPQGPKGGEAQGLRAAYGMLTQFLASNA